MVEPINYADVHTDVPSEALPDIYLAIGSVVLSHTLLEIQMSKVVASITGIGDRLPGHHLTANIDAVSKSRIVAAVSSTFKSNPLGMIEDFKPLPDVAQRLDRLRKLFDSISETRNVLAHGAVGYHGERLVMGSIQASTMLRASGGTEKWVYLDTVDDTHRDIQEALSLSTRICADFDGAYAASRRAEARDRKDN